MNKVPPTKIKTKDVPVIGGVNEATKKMIEETVDQRMQGLLKVLDPLVQNLHGELAEIEKRLSVVEEVKQLFPSKVEVIVKHTENCEDRLRKLERPGKE